MWAKQKQPGFTIVELSIVIVVIGILAAITIVAYSGISQRAKVASMQSDLANATQQLRLFQVQNSLYPTANVCPSPGSTEICLKASNGTTFNYNPNNAANPPLFSLTATNGTTSYVTLTNLAQNSDFSAGGAQWTNYCQAPSQCLFNSGTATLIASPGGRAWFRQNMAGSYTDGDKIFYSARIRKDSGSDMSTIASRTGGGYDKDIMTTVQFNASTVGVYARYSGIRPYVASQGISSDFSIGGISTVKTFQATIDAVVVINLTASFGAGSEPSVADMDSILNQFENSWFNGTIDTTY